MIASPLVQGCDRAKGVVAFASAAVGAAVLTGLILHVLASAMEHPPTVVVSAVAIMAAVLSSGATGLVLPGSPWRVPSKWSLWGQVKYATTFGGVLGIGLITALPSPGYYVLIAWGAYAGTLKEVLPVFVAYGAARATPGVIVSSFVQPGTHPPVFVDQLRGLAARLRLLEVGLLVGIGTMGVGHMGIS